VAVLNRPDIRLIPGLDEFCGPVMHTAEYRADIDVHGRGVFLTRYITTELDGHDDLAEACVPDYPPYGKRPLIDNGWYRTITRDDV
jgi:hypothetical protein